MLGVVLNEDTHVSLTVTAAVAVLLALWRVTVFAIRVRDQLLSLMRKVDIMWGFQTKRGVTEAENGGVLSPPLAVRDWLPDRVRACFEDLKGDLHEFYRAEGRLLSADDLKLEIEGRFGDRIVRDVCRVLRWHEGACLHAAAIIAREADQ